MTDNLKQTGKQDRAQINVNQRWELRSDPSPPLVYTSGAVMVYGR